MIQNPYRQINRCRRLRRRSRRRKDGDEHSREGERSRRLHSGHLDAATFSPGAVSPPCSEPPLRGDIQRWTRFSVSFPAQLPWPSVSANIFPVSFPWRSDVLRSSFLPAPFVQPFGVFQGSEAALFSLFSSAASRFVYSACFAARTLG